MVETIPNQSFSIGMRPRAKRASASTCSLLSYAADAISHGFAFGGAGAAGGFSEQRNSDTATDGVATRICVGIACGASCDKLRFLFFEFLEHAQCWNNKTINN